MYPSHFLSSSPFLWPDLHQIYSYCYLLLLLSFIITHSSSFYSSVLSSIFIPSQFIRHIIAPPTSSSSFLHLSLFSLISLSPFCSSSFFSVSCLAFILLKPQTRRWNAWYNHKRREFEVTEEAVKGGRRWDWIKKRSGREARNTIKCNIASNRWSCIKRRRKVSMIWLFNLSAFLHPFFFHPFFSSHLFSSFFLLLFSFGQEQGSFLVRQEIKERNSEMEEKNSLHSHSIHYSMSQLLFAIIKQRNWKGGKRELERKGKKKHWLKIRKKRNDSRRKRNEGDLRKDEGTGRWKKWKERMMCEQESTLSSWRK